MDVILDKGLGSFSLREVARRADVSHAAPGYHFGDTRGLLTAVAVEGFDRLRTECERAVDGVDEPAERLRAIGRAYVRVAVDFPGHCQVIFRNDVIDPDDPDVEEAGLGAFGVLAGTVEAVIESSGSSVDAGEASLLCWSAMQGLVALHDKFVQIGERTDRPVVEIEELADRFTTLMLDGIAPD